MTPRASRRLLVLSGALLLLTGAFSTAFWISRQPLPAAGASRLALAGLGVCAFTALNLALRWMRWHFLLRTLGVRLRARESGAAFFSLLPMILTPWSCGDLLLAALLRHRVDRPVSRAATVWIASRGADALALLLLLPLLARGWIAGSLGVVAVSTLALSAVERTGRAGAFVLRGFLFLGLSLLAWIVVAAGAEWAARLLGAGLSANAAAEAFVGATLGGALSGAPGGVVLTGSRLIQGLAEAGTPLPVAVWAAAVLRWGTTGFAVAVGLLSAWTYRAELRGLLLGIHPPSQGHFEALSDDYAGQIPAHIRDRLVGTKSDLLAAVLRRHGVPADGRGLDIGCGQGWYLADLARRGFRMAGCDLTAGQIEQARAFCAAAGVEAELQVAGAESLPFPDASLDFAYAINVFHHITDPATLRRAFAEITRTLRPGAPLVVFEMNTLNPLFRFYMSYLFPLLRDIDDGTEVWLTPGRLPAVPGAAWSAEVDYLTFLPDFLPAALLRPLARVEAWLEQSPLRRFSAHFAICLVRQPAR